MNDASESVMKCEASQAQRVASSLGLRHDATTTTNFSLCTIDILRRMRSRACARIGSLARGSCHGANVAAVSLLSM